MLRPIGPIAVAVAHRLQSKGGAGGQAHARAGTPAAFGSHRPVPRAGVSNNPHLVSHVIPATLPQHPSEVPHE